MTSLAPITHQCLYLPMGVQMCTSMYRCVHWCTDVYNRPGNAGFVANARVVLTLVVRLRVVGCFYSTILLDTINSILSTQQRHNSDTTETQQRHSRDKSTLRPYTPITEAIRKHYTMCNIVNNSSTLCFTVLFKYRTCPYTEVAL